ncbi:DUF3368 domain-containing protein [bacterium]|nr:MAG: DUF3368 domain-containing protein [bacterium]RIK63959.1 MAG: hypothetical protein DCC64_06020 [Planctomycetota bacterium]
MGVHRRVIGSPLCPSAWPSPHRLGRIAVLAKKSGLIPSIRPPLKSMLEAGVHLSNDLILAALREAGEGTEL